MKRVYLSGPITADPEHYQEHFQSVAEALRAQGFEVTNPATKEYDDEVADKGHTNKWTKEAWVDYIKRDIDLVTQHDIIYLLEGWQKSSGALVELATAKRFGLELMFEGSNLVIKKWNIIGTDIVEEDL